MADKYISLENLSRFKDNADNTYVLKNSEVQEITGNLSINGNLSVNGTTTTVNHENITVNSAVIITNNNGADLSTTLSGLAIKTGTDNQAYGIMFSEAEDESVLLGLGTVAEDNSFSYIAGEGAPLAIRDDSRYMRSGYILTWDSSNNRIVSSSNSLNGLVYESDLLTSLRDYAALRTNNTFTERSPITLSNLSAAINMNYGNYYTTQYRSHGIFITSSGVSSANVSLVYPQAVSGENEIEIEFPQESGTVALESYVANEVDAAVIELNQSIDTKQNAFTVTGNGLVYSESDDGNTLRFAKTIEEEQLSESQSYIPTSQAVHNYVDAELNTKVDKLTVEGTTGAVRVYSAEYNGTNWIDGSILVNESQTPSSVVIRTNSGTIRANTPTDDWDVATRNYVTGVAAEKVSRLSASTGEMNVGYAYYKNKNGNDSGIVIDNYPTASAIAAYGTNGILKANTVESPADNDVVNIGYLTQYVSDAVGDAYTAGTNIEITEDRVINCTYEYTLPNTVVTTDTPQNIDSRKYFRSKDVNTIALSVGINGYSQWLAFTPLSICQYNSVGTAAIKLVFENVGDVSNTITIPNKTGTLSLLTDIPSYTEFSGVTYTQEEGAEISYGNNKINLPIIAGDNVTIDADESNTHLVISATGGTTPTNIVTTDTEQTITGKKTFTGDIICNRLNAYLDEGYTGCGITVNRQNSPRMVCIADTVILFRDSTNYLSLSPASLFTGNYDLMLPVKNGVIATLDDVPDLDNYVGIVHFAQGTAGSGIAIHDTSTRSPYTKYGYNKIEKYGNSNALQYTLNIPNKTGTLALVSDIPSTSNFVTLEGTQHIVGNKFFDGSLDITQGSLYVNDIAFLPMSGGSVSFNPPPTSQEITINLPDKDGTVALVGDLPRSITLTPTPSDDGTIYGTVGSSDLSLLQASDNNYVTLNGKLYRLSNKQSTTLSYTNTDIDSSGNLSIGTIIVTISGGAWQLYESSMASSTEISNIFDQTTTYTETYNVDSVDELPQTASAGALANVSGTYYKYEE